MKIILVLSAFGLFAGISTVTGECVDLTNAENPLKVTDRSGNTVAMLSDCMTMVRDYLFLCQLPETKQKCCRSCERKDLTCVDKFTKIVVSPGAPGLSCSEFTSQYPCFCKNKNVRQHCCRSCKEAGDLSWCDCQDLLSPTNPINVAGPDHQVVHLSSCQQVLDHHKYLCADALGNQKGYCCKSCSGVCVDSRSFVMSFRAHIGDGRRRRCRDCTCAKIRSMGPDYIASACKFTRAQKACCDLCSS